MLIGPFTESAFEVQGLFQDWWSRKSKPIKKTTTYC